MLYDLKENPYQKSWWDEDAGIFGLTRNDTVLVVISLLLVVFFFSLDWDWIFGFRQ